MNCVVAGWLAFANVAWGQVDVPKALDPRLEVRLVAAAPDVVHPVAVAFDAKGRLLVVESHTHFPPKDYRGPKHDRILLMDDLGPDGRARKITVFHEGLRATMDLLTHPDGSLLVATRNEIVRLRDRDGDGKADERTRLAFLETDGDYPHNGLSGLALDERGDLFFGMGENLGASYRLVAADGTTHAGGGEGGNVFRLTKEGGKLRRFATGFWNPFGVHRDSLGRIWAVDNDPDSRPPCRLLHVVEGGDYGYQFRYGRSGRHPFQAWNGELPGTLPMVAGTGEAPCEVLCYESGGLPKEYRGELLVTAWADHRLERYTLTPKGESFVGKRSVMVQGGKDFRPSGMCVAPDGSLFVADWVLRDYTLHGKGAVWQVRTKSPADVAPGKRLRGVSRAADPPSDAQVLAAFSSSDPFARHQAVMEASRRPFVLSLALAVHPEAERIGLALAHRASGKANVEKLLPAMLRDPAEEVRFLAAKWIADERLVAVRKPLVDAMREPGVNSRLYYAYATAIARLDNHQVNEQRLADIFLQRVADEKLEPAQRASDLRLVPTSFGGLSVDRLAKWCAVDGLRTEALRALVDHPNDKRFAALRTWASDANADPRDRALAIVGLAHRPEEHVDLLEGLMTSPDKRVADETLRALIDVAGPRAEAIRAKAAPLGPLGARVSKNPYYTPRAKGVDWAARLDEGTGDPDAGRAVFFHPRVGGCYRCHAIDGRGRLFGPDLSNIGQRERKFLVESILAPSREVAPHFQAWHVETSDGKVRLGLLIGTYLDECTYLDGNGDTFKVNTRDIAETRPATQSLMPENLADRLTDQELRDLLAYLATRK